ncbi:unnamed protein product [Brassica rapa subsp. narinosa]|uniref:(rape) hypothetical protein n=1 Tax=Brassica napus TaxID=3708 RepID=A0A816Y7F0_BRANA|nr:unnamed protein product [Brassica napus]
MDIVLFSELSVFDLGNDAHVTTHLKECSPSEPHKGFTVKASRKVNDGLALKQFHGRDKDKMESHATLFTHTPVFINIRIC